MAGAIDYLRANGKAIVSRLIPYWLIVLAAFWIVTFLYIWTSADAYTFYETHFATKLFQNFEDDMITGFGSTMVGFIIPMMFAASVAAFLVTDTKLPAWRIIWVNKVLAFIRRFRAEDAEYGRQLAKKNQFGLGEQNFNALSIWWIVLPQLVGVFGYLPVSYSYAADMAEDHGTDIQREKWVLTSGMCGWGSIMSLTFFLIPVARHSVLLTAMGWSPIHALRIHIWSGYLSFFYAVLHTVTMFIVFWGYDKIPLREQFIPKAECWAKDANFTATEEANGGHLPPSEDCMWQWWNLTGGFAMLWFFILWGTSINWVRRKNYRLFYVCHMVFGTLTIIFTILHFDFCGVYLLPSSAYYLAATAPTLIQALASRYRGGNKIVRVVALQDAGGCMELHVEADAESSALLKKEPNLYVKLCVPSISLIWHPFTVYRHHSDENVVRVLFRPVGPFTKLFAMLLTSPERPVTILDGFYRGSDRIAHALQHDRVTIIAGGVAITPFLSFIPSLLEAVAEQAAEDRILTGLTFHWAVREAGLEDFITSEFLRDMMIKANQIGVDFQVKVYRTGSRKALTRMTPDVESTPVDAPKQEGPVESETSSGSDSAEFVKEDTAKAVVLPFDSAPGIAVELARTMPARFTQMRRNIPYAAGFVCFMWLCFHLTFFQYSYYDDSNYDGLTKVTWYTILVVVLSVFYGAAVEGAELLYRKFSPAPHGDSFVLAERKVVDKIVASESDSSTFVASIGRPTVEQLLAEAKNASAPGIFMCGPTALCDDVWKEVRKENSFLGRTRYCMYDEPFEM